jgi:hypothetical protein
MRTGKPKSEINSLEIFAPKTSSSPFDCFAAASNLVRRPFSGSFWYSLYGIGPSSSVCWVWASKRDRIMAHTIVSRGVSRQRSFTVSTISRANQNAHRSINRPAERSSLSRFWPTQQPTRSEIDLRSIANRLSSPAAE